MRHDLRGAPVSSGSPAALERYETALTNFNPISAIRRDGRAALAESGLRDGHLFKRSPCSRKAKSSSWPRPRPRSATRCVTKRAPTTASAA